MNLIKRKHKERIQSTWRVINPVLLITQQILQQKEFNRGEVVLEYRVTRLGFIGVTPDAKNT